MEAEKAAERTTALLVLATRQLGTKCGQVVLILRTKLQRERQRAGKEGKMFKQLEKNMELKGQRKKLEQWGRGQEEGKQE